MIGEYKCPVCAVYFTPKKKNQVYCCKKCSDKAYKKRASARKFEKIQIDRKATCPVCGKEFIKTNSKSVLCGSYNCRIEWNRVLRNKRSKETIKRICPICGKEFEVPITSGMKFCSSKCRGKNRSTNKKEPVVRLVETRKTRKAKTSIQEISKAARDEGITYGQYVVKHGLYEE